jgi:hypothetical protein
MLGSRWLITLSVIAARKALTYAVSGIVVETALAWFRAPFWTSRSGIGVDQRWRALAQNWRAAIELPGVSERYRLPKPGLPAINRAPWPSSLQASGRVRAPRRGRLARGRVRAT